MNNLYEAIETIGQGAYGKVIKARNRQDDSLVAIKQLRTQSTEEGIPQTTLREITFLKDLDHPNIVKLLNVVSHYFDNFAIIQIFTDFNLILLFTKYN